MTKTTKKRSSFAKTKKAAQIKKAAPALIKLDIGCGPNKREGFVGMDIIKHPNVDIVHDLRKGPWPIKTASVEEVHCSHVLEHLTNLNEKWERVLFFNELDRILVPGGKATIIIPHWCSNRYYGDPTHKEPFSEMGFWYLNRDWRKSQAPHTDIEFNPNGYKCHLSAVYGPVLRPETQALNEERQRFEVANYKEVITDLWATITKTP